MMIPFALLLGQLIASSTGGGERCVEVAGERITAKDLEGAVAGLAGLAPDVAFGYAPRPGARRVLRIAEIQQLAAREGVDATPAGDVCVVRAMRQLTSEEIEAAMRRHLMPAPSTFVLHEWSRFPVPAGEIVFPMTGLQPLGKGLQAFWTGYVTYAGTQRFRIWARASVGVKSTQLVTKAAIRAHEPVRGDQILEQTTEVVPREQTDFGLASLQGMAARRPLPAGAKLRAEDLEQIPDVRQGEPVVLESRIGAAMVSVETIAQSAGRTGQAIFVLNASSGKRIKAVVIGPGRASISSPDSTREGNQ